MPPQQNQVYHFSLRWSFRPDEDELEEFQAHGQETLYELLKSDSNIDKFIFQLELTDEHNWHYQGYFHTKAKDRPKTWAIKHNDELPGVEVRASSKNGIQALAKYCMKQESRQAGPWADKEVYMGEDLPTELRPWQQQVKEWCLQQPDDRTIYWICDPCGNSGKSKFAKYMAFHHGTMKLTYADAKDLLNLVSKRPNLRCYIFDLSRTKPSTFSSQDLYSAMEDIKNGHFINTKYETEEVLMKHPNMIVFANVEPDMTKLTNDRWKVIPCLASCEAW